MQFDGSHRTHAAAVRDRDLRLHLRGEAADNDHPEVFSYIQASDGEIGHIEDFVIDDETWTIRYLIVDTRNWVFLDLPRDAVRRSPEYTAESLPTRDYEIGLHRHYERPGYWR